MSKKLFVVAALMLQVSAAYADAPGAGSFGLGASIGGTVGGNGATFENGLQGSYFATDKVDVFGRFSFATIDKQGTVFGLLGGLNYYVVKNPHESWGAYLGGALGLNFISPTGGNTTTQFVMLAGGGAEYYVSKHFGVQVFEGLQLYTEPTTVGFVTRVGLNWYF